MSQKRQFPKMKKKVYWVFLDTQIVPKFPSTKYPIWNDSKTELTFIL